jgi:hypothetical protein
MLRSALRPGLQLREPDPGKFHHHFVAGSIPRQPRSIEDHSPTCHSVRRLLDFSSGTRGAFKRKYALWRTVRKITCSQTFFDDLERQKVVPLLRENPAQSLGVFIVKLAITRWCALWVEQTLTFQKSNL